MWITIAKWLGLIAVALALVGIPIYWHGTKVDSAYDKGIEVGRSQIKEENEVFRRRWEAKESQEAQKRVEEGEQFQKTIQTMDAKLKSLLRNRPQVSTCKPDPAVSSILRNAAAGVFTESDVKPVRGPNPEVPGSTTVHGNT